MFTPDGRAATSVRLSWTLCLAPFALLPAGCEPGSGSPRDSTSPFRFTDVAGRVGIDFVHETGARGEYQLPEIIGSGCAWIDYDLDGDLDAYLIGAARGSRSSRSRLFRNDGPGGRGGHGGEGSSGVRFTDVTEASGLGDPGYGMGCAVGDYDGDGDPDLYVTCFGPNRLYRNRGDGAFEDATSEAGVGDPRWGASAAFVDVDLDRDLDLFVVNYMRHPPYSSEPCHDGAGRVEYCGPNSHFPPERDTLYVNQGDGTFRDATRESGMTVEPANGLGVVCADLNADGIVDLYVANDASPNHLWLGDGRGRFVDRGIESGAAFNQHGQAEAGMGVQAEDIDGDGHLDLLVTHLVGETHTLYRGDGRGAFDDITFRTGLAGPSRDRTGFGMALFDADHDGDLDLIVANGRIRRGPAAEKDTPATSWDRYAETDQFFEHVGPEAGGAAGPPVSVPARSATGARGFRFADRSEAAGEVFAAPHVGRGLAAGDYDGDGDIDVLVTACGGSARLLRNDTRKRGHWILLRVLRRGGKGFAHGARVAVRAGEELWVREVGPAYSYLSSNDPRLHFGVGPAREVDVSVRWPSGTMKELKHVPVDQIVTLEE